MNEQSHIKKYILTLERFPQRDFIKREGVGFSQEEAVASILHNYFAENKMQKIKLSSCLEIIS